MPKLDVYNISKLGVNVDKAQPFLEDGELTKAQNAIRDGIGEDGGLRKRPGLVEFNGSVAAGSVIGGIGVPLSQSFNTTRTFYMGRGGTSGSYLSLGWNVTANNFATNPTTISSGTPANPRGEDKIFDFAEAAGANQAVMQGRAGCMLNNVLYYAADNYVVYPTAGHTPPTVRSFDGTIDRAVCKIPYNLDAGATTNAKAVLFMLAVGGLIYLSTFDGGTSAADYRGRVFSLDPDQGVLTQIGPTFLLGYLPYCLTYYQGKVWAGTSQNTPTATGKVYWIRPTVDIAWTLDHTTTASNGDITAIGSYRGELYISTRGTAAVASVVKKRDTSGVWTDVDTNPYGAVTGNTYLAMVTFNDVLYVSAFRPSTLNGTIRKYNGTAWSDASAASGSNPPVNIFAIDNGFLYGLGVTKVAGIAFGGVVKTADGTTWTYPATNNGNIPVFGVFTV